MAIELGSAYFPSWEESPGNWDECYLGGLLLPGVCAITGLDCGPRIDKQTRRKKEGQKFADSGMKPATFTIGLTMVNQHWAEWLDILPKIYSIKPSGPREPLPIVHPLPNHMGIDVVYVKSVKPSDPTDAGIFKVSIDVEQWFQELKDPKTSKKINPKASLAALSKLGRAALQSGIVTAIPPVGPLLDRFVYGKPQPPAQKKKTKRGDKGSGGTSIPGGKR
jgi:hypothetical protein